jgi:hypothetical protein
LVEQTSPAAAVRPEQALAEAANETNANNEDEITTD